MSSLSRPATNLVRPAGASTGSTGVATSDLVPGANPSIQTKLSGTTTSDNITFTVPTGGSGSYTHALTLIKNPSNATGALSASNTLGPVTIGTMANGDSYSVVCTSTDSVTGATCRAVCEVKVSALPYWHTALDYDATAPATFGALAAGDNVIGALTWNVLLSTGSPTIDHTNGVGITCTPNVSVNTQALAANVYSLLTASNLNPIRVSMVVDSISINTNSQAVVSMVGSGSQATSGSSRVPTFSVRLHRTSSTDFKMRTLSNGTGSTIGATNGITQTTGITMKASMPTQAVFETYIYGPMCAGLITVDTNTIPTAVTDPFTSVFEPNSTYNRAFFMASIVDRTTAIDPWPALWVGPGINGTGTSSYSYIIKRILIEEMY